MAIIINTKKTGIPVEIGELKFIIDTTDTGLEKIVEEYKIIAEEMEEFEGEDVGAAKELLRKGFDLFLGDGAFVEIYEQTTSVIECSKYLQSLVEGVVEEFDAINKVEQQEKVDKYLKNKKKK